jgi:hypothetical protein
MKKITAVLFCLAAMIINLAAPSFADKMYHDPAGLYSIRYPDNFEASFDKSLNGAKIVDPITNNIYMFRGDSIKELEGASKEVQFADMVKSDPSLEEILLKEFKSFEEIGFKLMGKSEYNFDTTRGMVYDYSHPDGAELRMILFIKKTNLFSTLIITSTANFEKGNNQMKSFLQTMTYK